jgi:hypothetical protein
VVDPVHLQPGMQIVPSRRSSAIRRVSRETRDAIHPNAAPSFLKNLPFEPKAAHLFFQLVSRRYERGAMLVTSNRAVGESGSVFGNPVVATAILDRLLHHSHVVTTRRQAPQRAVAEANPSTTDRGSLMVPPDPPDTGTVLAAVKHASPATPMACGHA